MSSAKEIRAIAERNWEQAALLRDRILSGLADLPPRERTKAMGDAQDNYNAALAEHLEAIHSAWKQSDGDWAALLDDAKAAEKALKEGLKGAKSVIENIKGAAKLTQSVVKLIDAAKEPGTSSVG